MMRTTITLSDAVTRDLIDWADQQGRPVANLASYLVELGIQRAKDSGQFVPRPEWSPDSSVDISERFRQLIQRLAEGNALSPTEIARLGRELSIDEDILAKLCSRLKSS